MSLLGIVLSVVFFGFTAVIAYAMGYERGRQERWESSANDNLNKH